LLACPMRARCRAGADAASDTICSMPSRPQAVSTAEHLLEQARGELERLSPAEALAKTQRGAVLVDIRSEVQRRRDGDLLGAKCVPRKVLEWRLDPSSPHRDPEAARRDVPVILICDEGYQSTLAAATLRQFGLDATDAIGGFQAWRAGGLAVEAGPADQR